MENEQHIKSLNTDARGKNRLRFSSTRKRSKNASADVYRSYKRRIGVTSAASREERVHHPHQDENHSRNQRQRLSRDDDRIIVLGRTDASSDDELDNESTFASELDLAHDRNASETFGEFYREIWHLVRSLPEVLHHASQIIDISMSYMLSPESNPMDKSPAAGVSGSDRLAYVTNHATTDILHLLAVLAKDLRHEIHPYVHSRILPRIVYDLLNPPVPPPESGRQPLPMSVTVVEAAFRTLSYVFRYDSESILSDIDKEGHEACLEMMRQYYGPTLGHKRDYVRRLAAECFAPMVRKLKADSARRKHIRRVLRALAVSARRSDDQPIPSDNSLKRAQSDAVDGVSFLLFETARGMSGRLHSKGHQIIGCVLDCLTGSSTKGDIELIHLRVTCALVRKVCDHLEREHFAVVWEEVFRAATKNLSDMESSVGDMSSPSALSCILELMNQIISFKSGIYIRQPDKNGGLHRHESCVNGLVGILRRLLDLEMFRRLSPLSRKLVLKVLCSSWRALPDSPVFAAQLSPLFPAILSLETFESADLGSGDQEVLNPAVFLARDLLPFLPCEVGMKLVGRAILVAAAKHARDNPVRSIMLMFSVVSVRPSCNTRAADIDDDDNIFNLENASLCSISSADKEALVNLCLLDTSWKKSDVDGDSLARLGVSVRCLPFLLLAGSAKDDSNKRCAHLLKKIWNWCLGSLKALGEEAAKDPTEKGKFLSVEDFVVTKSLMLECCARMAIACFDDVIDASVVKKCLLQMRPYALTFLLSHPHSNWAVKSVAAFVGALEKCGIGLSDSPNEVLEALVANLRRKSHFLRLHTLEILASFPRRPYITDHAEIDWTDDLDEEPSEPSQVTPKGAGGSNLPTGLCDLIESLLKLESTSMNFRNERLVASYITRVEVLSRTGKLPVLYAAAASNHMLGILHVKFSPIWKRAVGALISLASRHEACVWQPLAEEIKEIMTSTGATDIANELESDPIMTPVDHHRMCLASERTNGNDPGLFRDQVIAAHSDGRVSRHLTTDEPTIFGLVWSVLEGAPELTAKRSRIIVPIFLEFLHSQYFFYPDNDPDARELLLQDEIEDTKMLPRERLGRTILDKRLLAFLKVFAAVNGPQQLYKHSLLLSIFTCFVSHRENTTAQAALSCVLKFKQPFVTPYAELLRDMLKKGELRDTMLKFNMSKESKAIASEYRSSLIPLVTRILFGRLSAHVFISKASKETPSARRAAVMSFLSVLDGNDDELYPLFYLMVRSYIPSRNNLKPVEKHDEEDKQNTLVWLESMQADDVSHLRDQRHEGFLNLLSAGIAQLGHDIEKFVPAFISILLALCKYSQVKQSADVSDSLDVNETLEGTEDKPRGLTSRQGVVRTLCFRRLAELHEKFASSTDFLPYAKSLWESLAVSVHELPVTVAYADRAPALLCLLQTLSSHPRLIPILAEHDEAVTSVMKCISDTSKPSVTNTSLDFVECLLTNGGQETDKDFAAPNSVGVYLIQKHLSLLLHQFAIRLGSKNLQFEQSSRTMANSEQTNGVHSQYTRWRELSILCRVSGLVVRSGRTLQDSDDGVQEQEVLQMLCELLLPFLSPDRRVSEVDQLNVIGILSSLFPRIGRQAARSHLPALSRLLGPYKGRRGISSLAVRQSVASIIQTIPDFPDERSDIKAVADVAVQLCAVHLKRVDEIDSDKVVSALSELGTTNKSSKGWLHIAGTPNEASPTILSPLISLCFHFLYDEDGVVSRAAFQALKSLISCAASEAKNEDRVTIQREPFEKPNTWVKLIETSVVPVCRSGLTSRSQPIRRLFLFMFAEVARRFKEYSSPNLYGDLSCLIRDDEPDLDFFLNVTHVQIHRRSRAFQRLCKMLSESDETRSPFSMQSLSSVLLPLSLHPVYESITRAEETLVLDAIKTVAAIARHLSWSKYHATLWTLLTQVERHKEQERFLVEAICSVIDAFHFNLVGETNDAANEDVVGDANNAVRRALEQRIIPKIESLLLKDKEDRGGCTVTSLRPSVALALLKLFRKFPVSFFEARLTRLLVVICDALKSKDSDARDIARKTLAKMAAEMDIAYLHDVIRQLAVTLTEGYRLHVRMATLHSILQELAKSYKAPQVTSSEKELETPFGSCIPAMMDLIQQDVFGTARERRETDGAKKRLVKEATGSKSMDSIELICRMLLFKPTSHAAAAKSVSSVHAVVSPFLQRLRTPDIDISTIGRIRECLTRVVVGLSHNETVSTQEVLPFVYASISPFVGEVQAATIRGDKSDDDSSDNEKIETDIQVSRTGTTERINPRSSNQKKHKKVNSSNVVEWRPSTLNVAQNSGDAREMKKQQWVDLHRVRDGASAPKLTGSNRIVSAHMSSKQCLNDPAGISAVTFGLSLLNSSLKRAKFDANDNVSRGMLDPFIALLTACVGDCRNNEVILLSLRCLGVLLRVDLPSVHNCSATLGRETLDILTSCGNISNLHQELTQGCFKTLTLLISLDAAQESESSSWSTSVIDNGESVLQAGKAMPLDAEQMQVLISVLKAAVFESDHHLPTLVLIKAIVSRKFVSSEFYDLMDTMLDLSVRSQKATVRQLSAKIFMQYLVDYPMGKARLEDHLKRVVLNVKYEYEEGRLSAIALVTAVIEKLPVELLEEHARLFFLPLVLQFVNDDSKDCREAIAKCLSRLLSRAPIDVVQSFYEYTLRWSSGTGPLQRTSLQLFGVFVDSRCDFLKTGDVASLLIDRLCDFLHDSLDDEWEIQYFSLVCLQKITASSLSALLEARSDLWVAIVNCLMNSHPWIMLVSSRMIGAQLNSLNPESFATDTSTFLVERPGSLYQVAKNLCAHLDLPEAQQDPDLSTSAIKSLTWIFQAMQHHPKLCFANDQEGRSPATWLMARLSNIAKPKGSKRRQGIFKCFAAFVMVGAPVKPYLEFILEPLHRSITESDQMMDSAKHSFSHHPMEESDETTLAKDVLQVLEESCGDETEAFLRAYGAVKTRAREKRQSRKNWMATEAVRDPEASAVRKMKKHEHEKKRRKRKVEESRRDRGGKAKRRHV